MTYLIGWLLGVMVAAAVWGLSPLQILVLGGAVPALGISVWLLFHVVRDEVRSMRDVTCEPWLPADDSRRAPLVTTHSSAMGDEIAVRVRRVH